MTLQELIDVNKKCFGVGEPRIKCVNQVNGLYGKFEPNSEESYKKFIYTGCRSVLQITTPNNGDFLIYFDDYICLGDVITTDPYFEVDWVYSQYDFSHEFFLKNNGSMSFTYETQTLSITPNCQRIYVLDYDYQKSLKPQETYV